MFDRHIPRLRNSVFLSLAGCAVLSLAGQSTTIGYTLTAVIALSVLFIISALVELILLVMEKQREVWEAYTEAMRAADHLAENKKLKDEGLEPLSSVTQFALKTQGLNSIQYSFLNLPIDQARLKTIAEAVLNGYPFSEKRWAGDGKLLTSSEFRKLQDEMVTRGLIVLKHPTEPRQGYRFGEKGMAAMRWIKNAQTKPPLAQGLKYSVGQG